jgi:hypothetical protein
MPRVKHRLVAPEATPMLPDHAPILPQLDPFSVGAHLDRRPTALAATEYLLLSNRTRQVFDTAASAA